MINPNEETTVNITLKVKNHNLLDLENWLNEKFELINFKTIFDTNKMYQEDKHFQKLVKQLKDLTKEKDLYIIKNNYKYET